MNAGFKSVEHQEAFEKKMKLAEEKVKATEIATEAMKGEKEEVIAEFN